MKQELPDEDSSQDKLKEYSSVKVSSHFIKQEIDDFEEGISLQDFKQSVKQKFKNLNNVVDEHEQSNLENGVNDNNEDLSDAEESDNESSEQEQAENESSENEDEMEGLLPEHFLKHEIVVNEKIKIET